MRDDRHPARRAVRDRTRQGGHPNSARIRSQAVVFFANPEVPHDFQTVNLREGQ